MSGKEKRPFNRKKPFAEPGSATANWGSETLSNRSGKGGGGKQSEPLVAQLQDGSGSGSHSTLRDLRWKLLVHFFILLFATTCKTSKL